MERIDVHCHAVPNGYRQYAIEHGHSQPDGMPALPLWSPEQHIALMDRLHITKSILSITSPGTHLTPGDDVCAKLMTRKTNEELSAVCKAYPKRFGFFASLPLPAVQESLAEIDNALDNLGAVGFAIMSNAGGVYPGDKALDQIFEKFNERKATVFMHPTTCRLLFPGGQVQDITPLERYPRPMIEFMFDETRAVTNLLLSGTVARFPDVTFIMSHCGCSLPSLIDRIGAFATVTGAGENKSDEFKKLLRERFYFDLAGFAFPDQIHGLLRLLGPDGPDRLLYGTDFPFTPERLVADLAYQIDEQSEEVFGAKRPAVYVGNAERLLKEHCS